MTIRPDGTDVSGRRWAYCRRRRRHLPRRPAPRRPPAAPKAAAPAPGGAQRTDLTRAAGRGAGDRAPAQQPRRRPRGLRLRRRPMRRPDYVVQLSSQKTEAEAQASFRSLQAKFPSELGSRQPLIRRADLGSKGVFYRPWWARSPRRRRRASSAPATRPPAVSAWCRTTETSVLLDARSMRELGRADDGTRFHRWPFRYDIDGGGSAAFCARPIRGASSSSSATSIPPLK